MYNTIFCICLLSSGDHNNNTNMLRPNQQTSAVSLSLFAGYHLH